MKNAHCTLHTAHCTLHTAHCTLPELEKANPTGSNFYSDFPQKNSSIPIVFFYILEHENLNELGKCHLGLVYWGK
jgi:hypothetical protein